MRFEPPIQVNPNPLGQVERFNDLLESLTWDERFHVPAPVSSISAPREAILGGKGLGTIGGAYRALQHANAALKDIRKLAAVRPEAYPTVDGLVATGNRVDPVSVVNTRPHGRPRKYADLAHLSPDDYRKEANRRHVKNYYVKSAIEKITKNETVIIEGAIADHMFEKLREQFSLADPQYSTLWEAFQAYRQAEIERLQLADAFKESLERSVQKQILCKKALDQWIEHFQPKGPE